MDTQLAAHILSHGTKFSDWYVGVMSNGNAEFPLQAAAPPHWIARDAGDADVAEDIEAYFHSFGCDGLPAPHGLAATIVFAYRKVS